MSNSSESRFNVTVDDLRRYDWPSKLDQHPRKDCDSFFGVFATAAAECEQAGDDLGKRVYALLQTLTSFYPDYDAPGNPYGPRMSGFNGQRTAMAEDLTDQDLQALQGIYQEIAEPDFRARVADVLWECKRDYRAAQAAVQAFLEAAEARKTNDLWPPYAQRLDRACRLSARLGPRKPLHQEVIAVVEGAIREFENDLRAERLCHYLMSLLIAHDAGDSSRYAVLAERLARDFQTAGGWDVAEEYWRLAAQWFRLKKEPAEAQRCMLAAAECIVSKAEKGLLVEGLGAGYASHWMGQAVEALRQAKADPARIKDVHRRFLELEHQFASEIEPKFFDPGKIPGYRDDEKATQEAAAAFVRGLGFEEAAMRFAQIARPTDVAALRKQVEDQSKNVLWDKLVDSAALDRAGKVADTMSAVGFDPDATDEETTRKKMVMLARQFRWPMEVTWRIEPARVVIMEEHGARRRDLFFLVTGNPFIPNGYEGIYLRGIQAGFHGDWLVAMNLLVPLLEASLRHVFQQHGAVTSTLETDGTQKERDINQLVWMPELERIFGSDLAFDLRGILVERFGHNLRNELAHGLMPEAAFYQEASVYLWWLVIRLCWFGYRTAHEAED